jgi:hypothetical protein
MKRIATFGITALLLWAFLPGVGELFENAMHLAQEGHFAHAAADGDHHDPPGPEHNCTGAMHLCSCCVSLSFLPTQAAAQVADLQSQQFVARTHAYLPAIFIGGIDHPPRA